MGIRNYREPDIPHPLQITFLEAAAERAWTEEIRTLLGAGRTSEADARLSDELAGFDGALARLCRAIPPADVSLEGWSDLGPVLAEWEGPPITAITLGLTNPADLVFEAGRTDEPDLLLGLYSDEAFPFASATTSELLAECRKELPGWLGAEEDVEFYCSLCGLAELNTALVHCKHRFFLRDGRDGVDGRAPGGYVEFVLGSWLLATRFLQAVERAVAAHGLPNGCRLIAGTVDIGADFVSVLETGQSTAAPRDRAPRPEPQYATLSMKPWVPREEPPASGPTLRQRLRIDEGAAGTALRPGFLARLFGRLTRR